MIKVLLYKVKNVLLTINKGEEMAKIIEASSLFIKERGKNHNEDSRKYALLATKGVKSDVIVRFTGGCGYMSKEDAKDFYDLFLDAFCPEFDGVTLFGGTRMVMKDDPSIVVTGITEVPPMIVARCEGSVAMGVIPMTQDIRYSIQHGLIVAEGEDDDYVTVVHPSQRSCLMIQQSVDGRVSWDMEYEECVEIIRDYRDIADWKSLLVVYNGGGTTEKEIILTAKLGWDIILIKGSGRKCDEYVNNQAFLNTYPNVHVVGKDASEFKEKLFELEIMKKWKDKIFKIA